MRKLLILAWLMSSVAKQKGFVSQPFGKLHKFGWTMTIWPILVNAEMNESSLFWGTITFANNCRHSDVSGTAGIFRTHI